MTAKKTETTQLDTSKLRSPNEDASKETTPLHDQLVEDLKNANPDDVTQFEEDDDPLANVGDVVEEEENA